MAVLSLSKITKYFGDRLLFEDVTFNIEERDKVGLIGANGTGKTTLFKIITGELDYDSGTINISRNTNLGYVKQHVVNDPNKTLYEEMLTIFQDLIDLEQEINDINNAINNVTEEVEIEKLVLKQHALITRFENEGGLTYKSHARSTLLGLGFTEGELDQPVNSLSGGQRSKLELGKMLLSKANLLLLDEPTNHLDIKSAEWLENFLQNYNGAFIVISHDRYFLDKVTNKTIEISNNKAKLYEGNYTYYLNKKSEDSRIINHTYENQIKEIKRIEGIIEQQRRWGREKNIRTAESKQKMLEKLKSNLVEPDKEEEKINFTFKAKPGGGNDVLIINDLSMAFDKKEIFSNVDIHIRKGERVFLLGDNGVGKTTLFKIIMGKLKGTNGTVKIGSNIDIGYYDQTQENLNLNNTIFDEIQEAFPNLSQTQIRNALAAFLFKGDDVFSYINTLSGGERAKVALVKIILSDVNFLLLDEPTNHLDINSREALEEALLEYDGTLFIISHDRYFINKLSHKIYYLTNEGVFKYHGNYDYFEERMKQNLNDNNNNASKKEDKSTGKNEYFLRKERAAAKRKLENQIKRTLDEIENGEEEIAELEELLATQEYATDYKKAMELSNKISDLKDNIDVLYEKWLKLQDELQNNFN